MTDSGFPSGSNTRSSNAVRRSSSWVAWSFRCIGTLSVFLVLPEVMGRIMDGGVLSPHEPGMIEEVRQDIAELVASWRDNHEGEVVISKKG